jgi:hypothetical protein
MLLEQSGYQFLDSSSVGGTIVTSLDVLPAATIHSSIHSFKGIG